MGQGGKKKKKDTLGAIKSSGWGKRRNREGGKLELLSQGTARAGEAEPAAGEIGRRSRAGAAAREGRMKEECREPRGRRSPALVPGPDGRLGAAPRTCRPRSSTATGVPSERAGLGEFQPLCPTACLFICLSTYLPIGNVLILFCSQGR